ADLIDGGALLGDAQRMAQRQDLHGDADLDAIGTGGDRTGDAERRRQERALRIEMEFSQPHYVEAPALGGVDLRKGLLEGLPLRAAGEGRELVEHAEFHDALLPFVSRRRATG